MAEDVVAEGGRVVYCGPSHVGRLRHAMKSGQIPPFRNAQFILSGGMPIWHPSVFHADLASAKHVVMVAGDFRFGNQIMSDPDRINIDDPSNTFMQARNIDRGLITPDNDKFLFEFALAQLRRIVDKAEGRMRIIFWDLFGREVFNRHAGRYLESGVYRHPIWNLDEVEARFPEHAAGLSRIIHERDLRSLYVDQNCHPSLKGFRFMTALAHGTPPEAALAQARALDGHLADGLYAGAGPCVIFGRSVFVSFLKDLLADGAAAVPPGWRITDDEGEVDRALAQGVKVVEVSALSPRTGMPPDRWAYNVQRALAKSRRRREHANFQIVFWEAWVREVLARRGGARSPDVASQDPSQSYAAIEAAFEGAAVRLSELPEDVPLGCVELNVKRNPTQLGLFVLSRLVENRRVSARDLKSYRDVVFSHFKQAYPQSQP